MTWTSIAADWRSAGNTTAGSEGDLRRVWSQCGRSLYRYFAVRTGSDTHQAEDFMQQLWMRSTLADLAQVDDLERWLRVVARNLIREHWRRQARRPKCVPTADPVLAAELAERIAVEELPDEYLHRQDVQAQLLLAVTELEAELQEAIVGHYFHGVPQATLARQSGVTPRSIERRLRRARAALRDRLRHLHE